MPEVREGLQLPSGSKHDVGLGPQPGEFEVHLGDAAPPVVLRKRPGDVRVRDALLLGNQDIPALFAIGPRLVPGLTIDQR